MFPGRALGAEDSLLKAQVARFLKGALERDWSQFLLDWRLNRLHRIDTSFKRICGPKNSRRPPGKLAPVRHSELAQKGGDMELHRADGNVQLRRDFLIGAIADHGVQDFFLPGAQGHGI